MRRRASNKGCLNVQFVEFLEPLDAVARRERSEREGRPFDSYLPVLERLGVSAMEWEETVQVTSRRFACELAIMDGRRNAPAQLNRGVPRGP